MSKNLNKVAIVTGASSGIGFCTAKLLAENGYSVFGLANNEFSTDLFNYQICDVTNTKKIDDIISKIFQSEGQIDLLVNCAGIGISGSVENTPNEKMQKIFDINFFGVVNMCKSVLPYMRQNKRGHIINISSVAGELPIPFQSFYSATKSALQSLSTALMMEVKPFGIKVACVLPGDTKTGFTASREKNLIDDASYGNRINKSIATMEKDEQNGMSPESVAKVICKIANRKNPKMLNVVGFKYKLFVFLSKILPNKITNKLLFNLYAK